MWVLGLGKAFLVGNEGMEHRMAIIKLMGITYTQTTTGIHSSILYFQKVKCVGMCHSWDLLYPNSEV